MELEEFIGEVETAHPGYLGSQDTFDVGILTTTLCEEVEVLCGAACQSFVRRLPVQRCA